MPIRHHATGGAAAVLLALSALAVPVGSPAVAADLYGAEAYPPNSSYGDSPYSDPRYGDMYRLPPSQRYAAPVPPAYQPDFGPAPVPRDRHGYLRDMPPPYAQGSYAQGCRPREDVRIDLERQGWSHFQPIEARGDVAFLRARRVSGHWFELTVDRCSGRVIAMHPAERREAAADDWRYRRSGPAGPLADRGPYPYGEPTPRGYPQAQGYPAPRSDGGPGYQPPGEYGYQGPPGY